MTKSLNDQFSSKSKSHQKTHSKFFQYDKAPNFSQICCEQVQRFYDDKVFEKSTYYFGDGTKKTKKFIFYEGPPSANGKPGIHHMMARTLKDVFCRYKSLQGYVVERNAGWDAHGLPIELGVEKQLGITKDHIGKSISVEEFNDKCRTAVSRYLDQWESFTAKIGYWVDMTKAYITCSSKYIETLWWIIAEINRQGLLYKYFSIQPYSPMAGTALSSHELNQPGCYRIVTDLSIVCQFPIDHRFDIELDKTIPLYLLAWTTTTWTLPANTALCVSVDIEYVLVKTLQKYTGDCIYVILAKKALSRYFSSQLDPENKENKQHKLNSDSYQFVADISAKELIGISYRRVFDLVDINEDDNEEDNDKKTKDKYFRVISDDFVTTDEGTGIVHIAPCYGADDARVSKACGIGSLDIVSYKGKYYDHIKTYGGRFVKQSYLQQYLKTHKPTNNSIDPKKSTGDNSLDVDLSVDLKKRGLSFRIAKYQHSYPHCWRTDQPIIYLKVDSWFIKTSSIKDELIKYNEMINWYPKSTGEYRFKNWLVNLVDWNISRSRYWGTPLPIWVSKDKSEQIVIGSLHQLKTEIDRSIELGLMKSNFLQNYQSSYSDDSKFDQFYENLDLHRTNLDKIVLAGKNNAPLYRENDVIDVWFDSGAMPYASVHYPFANQGKLDDFPADFIAEGVDQTRGWFFSLHVLGSIIKSAPAYKNVLSNGLVLDKNAQKMSKRLGNAIDPDQVIDQYGADVVRWYILSQSKPWDNIKFDEEELKSSTMKFFATLFHSYHFFALYANLDSYDPLELDGQFDCIKDFAKADLLDKDNNSLADIDSLENKEYIDKWILSELALLVKAVSVSMDKFDPCSATRKIQYFSVEKLSNWYIRLSRKRYWHSQLSANKIVAYNILWQCLYTLSKLIGCFCPMVGDRLYLDLTKQTFNDSTTDEQLSYLVDSTKINSVHLDRYPIVVEHWINHDLSTKMEFARNFTTVVLSLREQAKIKVRQPLKKAFFVCANIDIDGNIAKNSQENNAVLELIKRECNIKQLVKFDLNDGRLKRIVKPNYQSLGKKLGKYMKPMTYFIDNLISDDQINKLIDNESVQVLLDHRSGLSNDQVFEFELFFNDILVSYDQDNDLLVSTNYGITVALDTNLDQDLIDEGIARELVNRIQNIRKDRGFNITDKIDITIITCQSKSSVKDTELDLEKHLQPVNFDLDRVLESYRDYIVSQTMANNLIVVKRIDSIKNPFKLSFDGYSFLIGVDLVC